MSIATPIEGNLEDYSFSRDGDNIAITEIDNPSNITQTETTSQVVFSDGATIGISTSINNVISSSANTSSYDPKITTLSDGGYILVWEEQAKDDQRTESIQVRKYDSTGTEVWKYSVSADEVDDASIVELADQSLLLSWGTWNDGTEVSSIYTQSLKTSDSIINGTLIKSVPPVTVTSKSGTTEVADPQITLLENGKYLVSWQEEKILTKTDSSNFEQDESDGDVDGFFTTYSVSIQGKIYPAGTSIPTLFTDGPVSTDSSDYSIISNTASGGFWMATTTDETIQVDGQPTTYSASLAIREYDATGKLIPGHETDLKNIESSYSNATYLTIQQVGTKFVASWIEEIQFAQPSGWFSFGRALMTQHYVVDGGSGKLIAEGDVKQISPAGPSINGSSITTTDDSYILSWATYPITRGNIGDPDYATWPAQLFAQRFDQNGQALDADPILISTLAEGQYVMDSPIVEQLSDGGFITSWMAHAQAQNDDTDNSIYAQRFNAAGEPLGSLITTITGDDGNNTLTWTGTDNVVLVGGAGGDTLQGGSGDDLLDGGDGDDTVAFSGESQNYTLGLNSNGQFTVSKGTETDTLDDIEEVQFSDGSISIDSGRPQLNFDFPLSWEPNGTLLSNGFYVQAWESGEGEAVKFQVFDENRQPIGDKIVIEGAGSSVGNPYLSAFDDGFIFAWSTPDGVSCRLYDPLGIAQGITQSIEFNNPNANIDDLAITELGNGKYAVTWSELEESVRPPELDPNWLWEADTISSDAWVQVFQINQNGTHSAVSQPSKVDTATKPGEIYASENGIAAQSNGSFAVVWERENDTSDNSDVYLQRYDANGVAVGGPLRVNTSTTGDQYGAEVTALASGYVVTWTSTTAYGENAQGYEYPKNGTVYMQRYDANGNKLGVETKVNTSTGTYGEPAITTLTNGNYVITWATSDEIPTVDGVDNNQVFAQMFDKNGNKLGAELLIDRDDDHLFPSVTPTADGGFIVTWEELRNTDTGKYGELHSQYFDKNGNSMALNGDDGANTITWSGSTGITLSGGQGNDTLTGGAGNDILNGGAGADAMAGGAGSDTYTVDNAKDSITENANEGIDTVNSSLSLTLGANLENLTLTGTAAINGTGNGQDNVLIGNSAINILTGGDGNDTLDGKGGADKLIGGKDDDTYFVDLTSAGKLQDAITELATTATYDGGIDTVELFGTSTNTTAITLTVTANTENLDASATGLSKLNLTGSTAANVLVGNAAANILDGKAGADTLVGGDSDDTYVVDNVDDEIFEEADQGIDLVKVAIATAAGSYALADNIENGILINSVDFSLTGNDLDNKLTGNAAANTLTGGEGNDTLDGKVGADRLIGGAGDDIYVVDNINDIVVEGSGEGTDLVNSTISHSLLSNIENITLLGTGAINATGNALGNVLIGNTGANLLDGGSGADTMTGGKGNDTYVVDDAGDVIIEDLTAAQSGGTDTVKSSISYTLGANLDNLTLIEGADINGAGNELNNTLTGNDGNNILSGDGGFDKLIGGKGDDTYLVDLTTAGKLQDAITEKANSLTYDGGVDTVVLFGTSTNTTAITLTVTANTENLNASETGLSKLHLTGSGVANVLTGNDWDNTLSGGAGTDTLYGGAGNDILIGGSGADLMFGGAGDDIFRFSALTDLGLVNTQDVIADFATGDKLDFKALGGYSFKGEVGSFDGTKQLRTEQTDDGLILYGNSAGDLNADFSIKLTGITELKITDFILA